MVQFPGSRSWPKLAELAEVYKLQKQSAPSLVERMLPRFKPKPLELTMVFTQKLNPNMVFGGI